MMNGMTRAFWTGLLMVTLMWMGCAALWLHGVPPEVILTNLTPIESTLLEQRVKLDLRIQNPNDFDLHITGVDVRVDVNGKKLARGFSRQDVTVPSLGEATLSLVASTSMLDVLRQVMILGQQPDISYKVTGTLHLGNSGLSRLPFESSGTLVEKGRISGTPVPPTPH